MRKKSNCFSVHSYGSSYVRIPAKRLVQMIKVGDVIEGNERFLKTSAEYTKFRVTFVDHWGVYAVPTEEYLSKISHMKRIGKEWFSKAKGHHKFKWCNITAIDFKE